MKKLFKQKDLDKIDHTGSPRVRDEVRRDVVEEYAEAYTALAKLPEPVLFEVEKDHYLIGDGWHRIAAMRSVEGKHADSWIFEVQKGNYEDCLIYALQANLRHGVRRSNADKRQCAVSAVGQFYEKSNESIATIAGVGPTLVMEVRAELEKGNKIPESNARKGKDGKTYATSSKRGPAKAKTERKPNDSTKEEGAGAVSDSAAPAGKFVPPADKYDKTGYIIPEDVKPLWARGVEIEKIMSVLSEVKCQVDKSLKSGDPLYAEVSNAVVADLKMVREAVSYALPYSVCPTCNGRNSAKCGFCRGRGLVSEIRYNTISESLRKVREKVCKK